MNTPKFDVPIVLTKSGQPALWEEGGRTVATGQARAVVVAGPMGEKLVPYFVHRGPDRKANVRRALLPMKPGHYILQGVDDGAGCIIQVVQVRAVNDDPTNPHVVARHTGECVNGAWDVRPPAILNQALAAVARILNHSNCRDPEYALSNAVEGITRTR